MTNSVPNVNAIQDFSFFTPFLTTLLIIIVLILIVEVADLFVNIRLLNKKPQQIP